MKRAIPASALLLLGGVLVVAGLPLQWSTIATTDGAVSLTQSGTDYAGYDIITTVVLGLLLVGAAFAVAADARWSRPLAVVAAILAALWGALVYMAAANPTVGGNTVSGVVTSVGAGAYVIAAGGLLGLIGAALSFVGRVGAAAPRVQPDV